MKIIETKDVSMKDIQDPSTANQFRVNGTDVHHVEELELSMDLKGLKNPISIKKDGTTNNYLIVDGCHRYLAAERLGWTKIKANIFQPGTRDMSVDGFFSACASSRGRVHRLSISSIVYTNIFQSRESIRSLSNRPSRGESARVAADCSTRIPTFIE